MTDLQLLFDIAIGLVSFLGGYILFGLRESIKTLHEDDRLLTEKVQAIEVLVAGKYVTREDLQTMGTDLFNFLRRIEEKLDRKVDK